MKINIKTSDATIIEAVRLFEKYWDEYDFIASIANHGEFNECDLHGYRLGNAILQRFSDLEFTVTTYRPWNPWSKAIAYASGKTIYFNTRKSFPLMDRVETIWHECSHLAGFKHRGNQNNEWNRGTLPYFGAGLFREFVEQQEKLKGVA